MWEYGSNTCFFVRRLYVYWSWEGFTPVAYRLSNRLTSLLLYLPPEDLIPCIALILSFTFVTFLILWPFSPAASSVSWYQSCHVCSGLAYKMYSGGGPSLYVYCVVCYRVIVAPYVRSIGCVFAYPFILDDNSERPMDYETSLLPKVFPLIVSNQVLFTFKSRKTMRMR